MNHPLLPRHDQQCHIRSPVPSPPLPPIPLPEEDHVTLSSPHHDISKQAFSRIALPGSPPLPRRRSPGSKPVRRSAPQPAMASQRFNRGRTNGDGASCQCCLLVGNSALSHSASRSFFVFAVRLARGLAVALSRLAGLVGGGGDGVGGFPSSSFSVLNLCYHKVASPLFSSSLNLVQSVLSSAIKPSPTASVFRPDSLQRGLRYSAPVIKTRTRRSARERARSVWSSKRARIRRDGVRHLFSG